jgi:hypothetical protein
MSEILLPIRIPHSAIARAPRGNFFATRGE